MPIGLGITLVCAIAVVLRPARPPAPAVLSLVGLLGLGVWSLTSTAWAESVENAVVSGNRWLVYGALLLLMLALVSHERRAAVVLGAATLGVSAVALSVLVRMFGGQPWGPVPRGPPELPARLHQRRGLPVRDGHLAVPGGRRGAARARRRSGGRDGHADGLPGAAVAVARHGSGDRRRVDPRRGACPRAHQARVRPDFHGGGRRAGCARALAHLRPRGGRTGRRRRLSRRRPCGASGGIGGRRRMDPARGGRATCRLCARPGASPADARIAAAGDSRRARDCPGRRPRAPHRNATFAKQWHAFVHVAETGEKPATRPPPPSAGRSRLLSGAGNRYDYWRIAWQVWKSHPLGGVGGGNYARSYFERRHDRGRRAAALARAAGPLRAGPRRGAAARPASSQVSAGVPCGCAAVRQRRRCRAH